LTSARHHAQVICMKLIENRISYLFGRFQVQWEEKQIPLFVLHFPQLLRILEKKTSDRYNTNQEYCRVRLRLLPLFLLEWDFTLLFQDVKLTGIV